VSTERAEWMIDNPPEPTKCTNRHATLRFVQYLRNGLEREGEPALTLQGICNCFKAASENLAVSLSIDGRARAFDAEGKEVPLPVQVGTAANETATMLYTIFGDPYTLLPDKPGVTTETVIDALVTCENILDKQVV